MKINEYRAVIVITPGLIYKKSKFEHREHSVLGENDTYLVLDDFHFTTLCKDKSYKYQSRLDVESLGHSIKDSCWGTSITFNLYTTKNKRRSSIVKSIRKYIEKELNLFGNVDLSFITEAAHV